MNAILVLFITPLTWKKSSGKFREARCPAECCPGASRYSPVVPPLLADLFSQFAMSKTNFFTIFIKHSTKKSCFFFQIFRQNNIRVAFQKNEHIKRLFLYMLFYGDIKFVFQLWSIENTFLWAVQWYLSNTFGQDHSNITGGMLVVSWAATFCLSYTLWKAHKNYGSAFVITTIDIQLAYIRYQ
jgi:hypothetical protein